LEEFIDFFTLTDPEARVVLALGLGLAAYLGWAALDFGASAIAPLAENRSTLRRLVALGLAVVATAVCVAGPVAWAGWALLPMVICLTPVIAGALSESSVLLPVVSEPFVRRGLAGRVLGRLFYPGWPTGVLFLVPLAGLLFLSAVHADLDDEVAILMACWFGTLLFPAVCLLPFEARLRNLFGTYAVVLVGGVLFAFVLALLADAMNDEGFLWLFAWLPQAQFVIAAQNLAREETVLVMAIAYDLILLGLLGILAAWRQGYIHEAERAVLAADRAETAPQPAP
jgi:hypothetical protein